METELQAARMLLYAAAAKLDRKAPDAGKWSAMAKRFVTDRGFEVANEALQIHGGYGYLHDYGIEKLVRDLRVHQILEGTNEIMRVIIARHLIRPLETLPEAAAMTTIAFIGLGNMGNPMAANLVKAGHGVQGFDLVPENLDDGAQGNGVAIAADAAAAVDGAEAVITMLPAGTHVLSVYGDIGAEGAEGHAFHRLLHHRRGVGAQSARDRGKQAGLLIGRRAGIGRHGRRRGRHADLHGRRRRGGLRARRAAVASRWPGVSSIAAKAAPARPPRSATT